MDRSISNFKEYLVAVKANPLYKSLTACDGIGAILVLPFFEAEL
jgi:hypothetical protein